MRSAAQATAASLPSTTSCPLPDVRRCAATTTATCRHVPLSTLPSFPPAFLQSGAALAPAFLGHAAPLTAPAARRQAAAAARPLRRAAAPATRAVLTYKEAASGVEFPLVQKLWLGDEMRCVGGGCRSKKVLGQGNGRQRGKLVLARQDCPGWLAGRSKISG